MKPDLPIEGEGLVLRRVVAVHTGASGRARFAVEGLKGDEGLKHYLERRLPGGEILEVTASTLTGRLLVTFRPDMSAEEIGSIVEAVLTVEALEANGDLPQADWHRHEVEEVCSRLQTSAAGLSSEEAGARLQRDGPNAIGVSQQRSRQEILLGQLQSLPVALLGASALLSLATGGIVDAAVILGVIGLNAAIGYVTENHAEQTIDALRGDAHLTAPVLRDGAVAEIAVVAVVPGDVIELRSGVAVPADARIIESHSLSVSEAALTGESAPVTKTAAAFGAAAVLLADRHNMAFRGTLVTGGWGRAVVVATGHDTELGKIQLSIGEAEAPHTPLQIQLDRMGRQLVVGSLLSAAALFGVAGLRGQGLVPALKLAISLAVAAVPEGLPTTATTTLALGINRLKRKGVLIRRLAAVEGLSSIQLICFDKTGTLTENRMAVARIRTPDGDYVLDGGRIRLVGDTVPREPPAPEPDLMRLLEVCTLCNDAEAAAEGGAFPESGSSTEIALLRAAQAGGIQIAPLRKAHARLAVRERTEQQLYMRTTHRSPEGEVWSAIKGSPPDVLALCRRQETKGRLVDLTEAMRSAIAEQNRALSQAGLRVLGVASAAGAEDAEEPVWLGLVAMADPLRPDAHRIIASFHEAGISTLMITGDQPATAAAIAEKLGLGAVNGNHREAVELAPVAALLHDSAQVGQRAFSRVTPGQKLKIVEALQRERLVVAMTGDGVNDAPSLRAADIGVALGGGTEIARQSADVILLEDELQGLAIAVENGRATYENIERAINYLLATNASEIALMLAVTASGFGQAMTPVQLLWLNLVTDVLPAIGLAMEPPSPDLMRQQPRDPSQPILRPDTLGMLAREAAVMTSVSLAGHAYAQWRHGATPRAGAVGFAALVSAQLLHALRYRAKRQPNGSARDRDYLAAGLTLSFGAQAAALFLPGLRQFFGGPIDLLDTAVALGCGFSSLALSAGLSRHSPERRVIQLEHRAEKWEPVFRNQSHSGSNGITAVMLNLFQHPLRLRLRARIA